MTRIVAFIDFDHAHPGSPLDDIVYSLEVGAPFRDDATCLARMHYQRRRTGGSALKSSAMRTACQHPPDSRPWSRIGSSETLQLVADLARRGIEPQATWVRDGYLDKIRQRVARTVSSGI